MLEQKDAPVSRVGTPGKSKKNNSPVMLCRIRERRKKWPWNATFVT
jgi:hypothetical protein